MLQILCISYNSQTSIYNTLSSWSPFVDRFCVLINGGINNDFSQSDATITEIKKLSKPSIIYVKPFIGFSATRNKLIDLVSDKRYTSIFIDDSYRLLKFVKPIADTPMQITIIRDSVFYKSVRILPPNSPVRYTGKIHETLDTKDRVPSEIVVNDDVYFDHIIRTQNRQEYDLLMCDDSPRGLYYNACTLVGMYMIGKCKKEEVIEALQVRINTPSLDTFETDRAIKTLNIIKNL